MSIISWRYFRSEIKRIYGRMAKVGFRVFLKRIFYESNVEYASEKDLREIEDSVWDPDLEVRLMQDRDRSGLYLLCKEYGFAVERLNEFLHNGGKVFVGLIGGKMMGFILFGDIHTKTDWDLKGMAIMRANLSAMPARHTASIFLFLPRSGGRDTPRNS